MLHLYRSKKSNLPSGFPLIPSWTFPSPTTFSAWWSHTAKVRSRQQVRKKNIFLSYGDSTPDPIPTIRSLLWRQWQENTYFWAVMLAQCFWLLQAPWPGTETASKNLNMQEMWSTVPEILFSLVWIVRYQKSKNCQSYLLIREKEKVGFEMQTTNLT